ncbi:MAG TPA: IPT/TIG domain-containing protein, partial [Thermoanaerobaculia bacterium]|nr:IPT/TIG domain-containing protein [Thermoanaerobaculia bacterium]
VAAIEPSSGYEAGGTQVRITGADFHSSCWPFFDAIPARDAIVRNRSEITAAVPAHAPGAAIVRVRCTTGEASLTSPFTFSDRRDPSPQITGVAPQFGTPGDVVTLTGTNFRADDVVAFDSSAATALDVSATTHVVRVPERSPGIVSVSLMDHDDHVTASGPMFTIGEASPPRVTALSPTTVAAGGEMELVGSGFRFGYTFAIGGRPAPLVLLSPTRAIVRVGGDVTPGSHVVQAINSAGHVASQGPAVSVIADGLIVSSVAGRCATSDGGLNVTISGAGFTRASAVTFNGVASPEIVFVDASTITARVPAGDVGPAKIVVSNPGGAWGTLTNAFRYESPFNPNGGCSGRTRGVRH